MLQDVKSTYKKRTEAAAMAGQLFEVKMLTLLFLRGLKNHREFRIASNMFAAGSFDDIVLKSGHRTAFMQLKHKQNAEIDMSMLLTVKGQFSLIKYYKSYIDIKQQWQHNVDLQQCDNFEDCLFIIFTNASLVDNVGSNVGSNEMLHFLNTEGKIIQFTGEQQTKICNVFRNDPKYKGDLSGFREFLSQLWLLTEQTGESALDSPIESELRVLFGNVDNFDKVTKEIQNRWQNSNAYLTHQEKFFHDLIQVTAANIIKDTSSLNVKFTERECNILKKKVTPGNRKFYLTTDCIDLSCAKVLQSFNSNLLVDFSTLQSNPSEVLAVWRFGVCDVLVVQGDTADPKILDKLGNMPDLKQVVVVSSTANHMVSYQQHEFVSCNDFFKLSQLEPESLN